MYNKLLQRQLQKHLGLEGAVPPHLEEFLSAVSASYDYCDRDRKMLERSIELSSAEMAELNDRLKQESQELRKAHGELKKLFDNINEVFFSIEFREGQNENLLQMSTTCEQVYGYTVEDFAKNSQLWFEVILEEDRPIIYANYPLLNAGQAILQEYRIRHKNGNIRWFESRITPTLEPDGRLARIDGVTKDTTARKEAEEKLKRSQAHLLTSQRIAKIGSWEVKLHDINNMDHNPITWTDETYRIFGYEPGEVEVTNEFFFKHLPEEDRAIVNEAFAKALETKTVYKVDHRIILRDNTQKMISESGEFQFDPVSGLPVSMTGTMQDITERKEAELALKKVEANLRNLLENTDTAYVLLDEKAHILSFNHLAKDLAEQQSSGPLQEGVSYVDIMLPERQEEVRRMINDVLQKSHHYSYEVNYGSEDTAPFWLYVRMHPILSESGKVVGLSVAATDITNQKSTERLIRESNERYELATQATRDIIWDWDIKNNTLFRSPNYHKMFGYQSAEKETDLKTWAGNLHPGDRKRVLNEMNAKINSGNSEIWEDEYRQLKLDGEYAYIQDRGHILYDANNKPVRMVGAMRDITEQKLYEIERQKITDDLIKQNQHLEQFAYIVSHNLRAPVANIIGFTDLINEPAINEEMRDNILSELSTSAKHLDTVIQDLNQILHVKGDLLDGKEKVRFEEITEEVIQSMKTYMDKEKVTLKTDFASVDGLMTIKSYLHSIFFNLISNSLKYRKPAVPPVIEVKSQIRRDKVVLTFKDNGLGIDMNANSGKIFGLYKRFHSDAGVEGKGMGLFMVKKQVESLNGSIHVKSKINKGTEFILEFDI